MSLMKKTFPFVVLLVLTACCMVNAMGRRAMAFYPKQKLYGQATSSYVEMKKKTPLAKNKRHRMMVERVSQRLVAIAKRDYPDYCKGFNWEVVLFEDAKTVNAWCMPGGKMAVYTGILKVCENEAALAAVMGHEISHALLEHGNERMSQAMLAQGATIVALAALEGQAMEEEERKTMQQTVGIGMTMGTGLVMLKYSRSHESEGDNLGLHLMAAAGYDPAEAPKLWQRMKKLSGGKQGPEFLSTHPSNDTRIKELQDLQNKVAHLYQAAPKKYGRGGSFLTK